MKVLITQLFTWQVQESQRKIDSMNQELQQCNSRYTAQAREVDRLQTVIQERDLTSSQQETMLKSDIAEREEDLHRFKAEISVLHEKLAQNGNQVQKLHYICIADKMVMHLIILVITRCMIRKYQLLEL